ncbi:MAG: hypothetical protein ACOY46_02790 [Bacillota bacterium]
MKIILENELERYAWDVMMSAHYKWEKNHGDLLRGQMEWYFNDIFKEETEEVIKKEVERRLRDEFGEEFFVSEDEYVKSELERLEKKYSDVEMTVDEKQELEGDLREEYRYIQEEISDKREYTPMNVEEDLRNVYCTFFNAPEELTVVYKDEVIQGQEKPVED